MAIKPLNSLLGLLSLDIILDLGTSNTQINVPDKGIIINAPSWVAIEKKTKYLLAIGTEAKEMAGRTPPGVIVIRPLRDGVISDFEATQTMLEYLFGKAHEKCVTPIPRPRVVVGVPAGASEVEKRAIYDVVMAAGARMVHLIEEPTAAALGAMLPIGEVHGSMIVDIGGGTTEMAVFTMGEVIASRSLRLAGDEMNQIIASYIRNKYNLVISERTAEHVKITLGSAYRLKEELTLTVQGLSLVNRLPEVLVLSSVEIREALSNSVKTISETMKELIDTTPSELVVDLMEFGVCLVGGGSQLQGLPQRLSNDLQIRVWLAEDPLTCVTRGAGQVLESLDENSQFLIGLEGRIS